MLLSKRCLNKLMLPIPNKLLNKNCYSEGAQTPFEMDFKKHHIPINVFQKSMLVVGSATMSILDPHRGDMIACLGETTGESAARYMMNKMQESPEGAEILKLQPRINTGTIDTDKLKLLPQGTLGKAYSDFLEYYHLTPDARLPVQFVDDINIAYVIQRYREVHDLVHTILGMPINMLGEVTVKWVEAIQTKLPMCVGGALFGPIRLRPKHRQLYLKYYLPWAIETGNNSQFFMNIFFEKRWEQPLDEMYKELNVKLLEINENKR